jgi:hypothetical protein
LFGGHILREKAIEAAAVVAPIRILIEISSLTVFPGQQDTGLVEGAVLGQVLIDPANEKGRLVVPPDSLTDRPAILIKEYALCFCRLRPDWQF